MTNYVKKINLTLIWNKSHTNKIITYLNSAIFVCRITPQYIVSQYIASISLFLWDEINRQFFGPESWNEEDHQKSQVKNFLPRSQKKLLRVSNSNSTSLSLSQSIFLSFSVTLSSLSLLHFSSKSFENFSKHLFFLRTNFI